MIELCAIVQLYVIQLINQFSHSYDHNMLTIFIFVFTEYDTHAFSYSLENGCLPCSSIVGSNENLE